MTNFDLSLKVYDFLNQVGVQNIIVCAGARNAPLVNALEKTQNTNYTKFKIYHFFEERSSAFFALGLIKQFQKPVAVLTTSGTAVAELLPAVIEAYYQGLPIIIVSADRPQSYRGSGAPQAIEQIGIFSAYVEKVYDFDIHTIKFDFELSLKKPVHLNICFDEPLIDQESQNLPNYKVELNRLSQPAVTPNQTLNQLSVQFQKPLVIVGELSLQHATRVKNFILKYKIPVYAESLSHLRHDIDLKPFLLFSSDLIVKKIFKSELCDSVIRIGGVPTLRFWRDLEKEFIKIAVFHFSDLEFTGLSRNSTLTSFENLENCKLDFQKSNLDQIKNLDSILQEQKYFLLKKYPLSEPAFVLNLSENINAEPLYLGNSLPIRHWDQFSTNQSEILNANRGANGIDGQISSYLGWSEGLVRSNCLVGDLTTLYDLVSLGLTEQLNQNDRSIFVLNNFGGRIFSRLFKNNMFINSHSTQFEYWAKMWNWSYFKVMQKIDFELFKNKSFEQYENIILKRNCIIEIQPNEEQTNLFWNEWDSLCQKL